MEKIPTAEEYWLKTSEVSDISKGLIKPSSCTKFMIEFAKMHVEAALKAASERADLTDNGSFPYVDKASILNSYSLSNIK